ncbi:retinol dehydrogenase 12-like isoform X1 [Harmonia axyridis]|uniref:retinol dehydrogenase 12-like isoform X1 n=2 Tax=Harmonia axyridis TaxID=115357 RepID=UPI001E27508E|nr:retinol dehydrogenase 12-like isoform X1 [Harmonia axyridis]
MLQILGVNVDLYDPIFQAVLILALLSFLVACSLLKFFAYLTCGFYRGPEDMNGKVVIITGANGGIGYETSKELARRGATVIMACRNLATASKARDDIVRLTKNDKVSVKKLDLSSQSSIREFAADINKTCSRLDVLIHNAGTAEWNLSKTQDNVETTMATNHFGPFLLTHLLIDLLKKSEPSRIVVVASELYRLASLNLDNINPTSSMFPAYLYYVSKYANIVFTMELAKRLELTGVTANCLHPGLIDSGIWRNVAPPLSWGLRLIIWAFFKTPEQGCQTTVFCAVSEELEGVTGRYFMDCAERGVSSGCKSEDKAKKLWELSESLAGLKPTDPKI